MNKALLKRVGNMEQLCSVRQSTLSEGEGRGMRIAQFRNAAGLDFTVLPDRCMDLYDFSYKGVNLSFRSKNGLRSSVGFVPMKGEFAEQWPGGMLYTCGLDNVGGHCEQGAIYPTHGRISSVPARHFGVKAGWEGDDYRLEAHGEMVQSRLYGMQMSLERMISTGMHDKHISICDRIFNLDAEDTPYLLLYHMNFGFPLLNEGCRVLTSPVHVEPLNERSTDPANMIAPEDGRQEELYLCHAQTEKCAAVLFNPELELGGYVAFETRNLPRFLEWKMMKSHDYVLALEPCNTWGISRCDAIREGKAAVLPAYSSAEMRLELGVVDGMRELEALAEEYNLREASL